jgi:hypothetical protein
LTHICADGDILVNSTATSLKKCSNRSSFKELQVKGIQKKFGIVPKIPGPIGAFGTKVHQIVLFNEKN